MYTDPDLLLCASFEKGRNGEFFVLRVTTHLKSSRHRPRSSWGKERKHLMHVNNSEIERGAGWAYKGHVSPITDQSWGPGEVLQLGQPAMRFDRQVDNII